MIKDSTERKEVRLHHYFFVQQILYNFIKSRTIESYENFTDEFDGKDKILKILWYKTYTQYKIIVPDIEKIDYEEIKIKVSKLDNLKTIVVLTLPIPQAMTESYFVGIYYKHIDKKSNPDFRYFTLEFHEKRKSGLCELSDEGHCLFGFNGILSEKEFLEEIKCLVKN